MSGLAILEFAIFLLSWLTQQTENKLDDLAVAALREALAKLRSVHGTAVTKQQLEALRVERLW
ncbi:MAG: hypothetical protein ACRD2R_03550 [Terriglobales bacterium]